MTSLILFAQLDHEPCDTGFADHAHPALMAAARAAVDTGAHGLHLDVRLAGRDPAFRAANMGGHADHARAAALSTDLMSAGLMSVGLIDHIAAQIAALDAVSPGRVQLRINRASIDAIACWFDAGLARLVLQDGAIADHEIESVAQQWPGGLACALADFDADARIARIRALANRGVCAWMWDPIAGRKPPPPSWVQDVVDLARATNLPMLVGGPINLAGLRLLAIHARDGIEGVVIGPDAADAGLGLALALAVAGRA